MKPFTSTLSEMRKGELLEELESELTDVVRAVRESGKSGKLTLTIVVKPASKGDVSQLFVDADVKASKPKADRASTLFFADETNQLSRRDPKQFEMELRTVASENRALRTVS
jgi:hypothetical protein